MRHLRVIVVFSILIVLKVLSRCLYRVEVTWVGERPVQPWGDVRLLVALNHTSLFEPLYAGIIPVSTLWRIARKAVAPAAAKTMDRAVVGRIFRLLGNRVIPISRQRDASWQKVLDAIRDDSFVVVFPEGRMKRADGLDSDGQPMTVRGGVADFIEAIPDGRMVIACSGGLHHVQCPGERRVHLFQTLRIALENLPIQSYRAQLAACDGDFKGAVINDLESRRDSICPSLEQLNYSPTAAGDAVENMP